MAPDHADALKIRRKIVPSVTIPQINERLQTLSEKKLAVVFDFISHLSEREPRERLSHASTMPNDCMLASEEVLRRDWERPEEDEAWANL